MPALNDAVDAAFKTEKTTEELIALALAPVTDNLSRNIKGRAYTLLAQRLPQDVEKLTRHFIDFDRDFIAAQNGREDWLATRIANVLQRLNPPSGRALDYTLTAFQNVDLPQPYPSGQKAREKRAIEMLENLRGHSEQADMIALKLADFIPHKFGYSPAVIIVALNVLSDYMPRIAPPSLDKLVAARFKYAAFIPDAAQQKAKNAADKQARRAHEITIWDYADPEEVAESLRRFDIVLCRHPALRPESDVVYIGRHDVGQPVPIHSLACAKG